MRIKRIDIVHHSHADYGYTDHPEVVRELQKRYIDIALDAVAATMGDNPGERFCWTAEILDPVWDWWKEADDSKRELLLKAIEAGQFEICGFAFNNTAFMNDDQWDKFFNWVPDDLWEKLKIRSGMQIDVNGIPVAGAMRALKKGIRYLWTGPNSYLGSVPFKQPSAFRWKMPEAGGIFVWLNSGYFNAHYLFNDNWREGPVPSAADLRYRKPEKGDIFSPKRDEILKAYEKCMENIKLLEAQSGAQTRNKQGVQVENTQFSSSGGYEYESLPVSLTNQWRIDNDPPFIPIVEFVAEWNAMGLKPELRLTTPANAMRDLENEIGEQIPEYEGEWVDWWAKGSISASADMAAARKAKRIIKAINSHLFNDIESDKNRKDKVLKELCMFDEHSWGSWGSVAYPYSYASRGQMAEKSCLAYRPLAAAELMLADKVRAKFEGAPDGVYVTNTASFPLTDWVVLPIGCLRGEYTHVKDMDTGELRKIIFTRGEENFARPESPDDFSMENVSRTFSDNVDGRRAMFWSGQLKPKSTKRYLLLMKNIENNPEKVSVLNSKTLKLKYDKTGWPSSVKWNQMTLPLFYDGFGEFISLKPEGFAPRWIIKDIFKTDDEAERLEKIEKFILKGRGVCESASTVDNNPYMITIEQVFTHPSLVWGKRILEVWKDEPRVRLNRKNSVRLHHCDVPVDKYIDVYKNIPEVFKLEASHTSDIQRVCSEMPGVIFSAMVNPLEIIQKPFALLEEEIDKAIRDGAGELDIWNIDPSMDIAKIKEMFNLIQRCYKRNNYKAVFNCMPFCWDELEWAFPQYQER